MPKNDMTPKSDIEIARAADMLPIAEVGAKLGIPGEALIQYGPHKGKVSFECKFPRSRPPEAVAAAAGSVEICTRCTRWSILRRA